MTRLSDFLDREIERGSFPGGVALVGSSGEILDVAFAGRAAVEPREEPTTPDTLYDLASLTKPLAVGALAVALPGLALGAPPGRYFPQWKRTRYDGITIEMLMTHTSGLPAWYPLYARGEGATAYRRTLCEIEPEARGLAWQGARGAASVGEEMSRRAFGHTGFTGTSVWIDPDAQRIWILLTNRIHPAVRDGNFNEVRRRFHAAALAAFPV